jgi:hypothetical protein
LGQKLFLSGDIPPARRVLEQAEARRRELEEKERLEIERRESEEKERQEAERRQKEQLETEQRQRQTDLVTNAVSASKENELRQRFVNVRKKNNRTHEAAKKRKRHGWMLKPVHARVKRGNNEKRMPSRRSLILASREKTRVLHQRRVLQLLLAVVRQRRNGCWR